MTTLVSRWAGTSTIMYCPWRALIVKQATSPRAMPPATLAAFSPAAILIGVGAPHGTAPALADHTDKTSRATTPESCNRRGARLNPCESLPASHRLLEPAPGLRADHPVCHEP